MRLVNGHSPRCFPCVSQSKILGLRSWIFGQKVSPHKKFVQNLVCEHEISTVKIVRPIQELVRKLSLGLRNSILDGSKLTKATL
jgi:hypothetical protein